MFLVPIIKMTDLTINDFRIFKDKRIRLGNYLTCIAGTNGTGKSNLLGLIGNCVEYRTGKRTKSFLRPNIFRTDFSEIFKGSEKFDPAKSKRIEIHFSDGDKRVCRTAWQKKRNLSERRFRVIPEYKEKGKTLSQKKELPVIYIGLSRLYPIGESELCKCQSLEHDTEYKEWIKEKATKILSLFSDMDSIKDVNSIDLSKDTHKIGVGFLTESYEPLCNSSGQDNIGQILSAVWRFKILKEELGDEYHGGILLIDELEATLHPASQLKLLDVLLYEAKKLSIQIVFTTHSLVVIDWFFDKIAFNQDANNNLELVYLSTAMNYLEVRHNASREQIQNEIYNELNIASPKIKIYSEDAEARWFFNNLLQYCGIDKNLLRIVDMTMGGENIISLYKADSIVFSDVIVVLDGDKHKELPQYQTANQPVRDYHFVLLPGEKSPEAVFLDALCDCNEIEEFFNNERVRVAGINRHYAQSKRYDILDTRNDKKKQREIYKEWFNQAKSVLESGNFFTFWADANRDICEQFKQEFITSYNAIAANMRIKPLE